MNLKNNWCGFLAASALLVLPFMVASADETAGTTTKSVQHSKLPDMLSGDWVPADTHQIDFARLPQIRCDHTVISDARARGGVNQHNYLVHHSGRFMAMWSDGPGVEDRVGQRVKYSSSSDGRTWSPAEYVTPIPPESGPDSPFYNTRDSRGRRWIARGFWKRGDQLIALASLDEAAGFFGKTLALHAFLFDESALKWTEMGVIHSDAINNFPPAKLSTGEWMMSRRTHDYKTTGVQFLIGGNNAVDDWHAFPVLGSSSELSAEEPLWWELADRRLVALFRDNRRSGFLYRSFSTDHGRSWSRPERTNFPDATSKLYGVRLSDGRYVLVSNANPKRRDPLTIAVSNDGLVFHQLGYLVGGRHVDYPYVLEHDGRLMVAFSGGKQSVEVLSFPLTELDRLQHQNAPTDPPPTTELRVLTDFEGASARVLGIDQESRTVRFIPGGDPAHGWNCWWSLRVAGVPDGETVILELLRSSQPTRNNGVLTATPLSADWAMPLRAAYSTDGTNWQQTEPGERTDGACRYRLTGTGDALWIAWGPSFTPQNTQALLENATAVLPFAEAFELAKTRSGRPVMGLRIREPAAGQLPVVWVQARQHAWESGASWVAQGFVEWLISDDEAARWMRSRSEIIIIPIMDVDNVVTGNGGKEADPRDHNRDWDDQPVYPEVAATQQWVRRFAEEGRMHVFLDLHNPAPRDLQPFFFLGPEDLLTDEGRDSRQRFLVAAQNRIIGPLKLAEQPRITGPGYHPLWRQISGQWVNANANSHTLVACLETAWNSVHSTTDGYRTVGSQLGQAVSDLLQGSLTEE